MTVTEKHLQHKLSHPQLLQFLKEDRYRALKDLENDAHQLVDDLRGNECWDEDMLSELRACPSTHQSEIGKDHSSPLGQLHRVLEFIR